jgi:hypothetical protein
MGRDARALAAASWRPQPKTEPPARIRAGLLGESGPADWPPRPLPDRPVSLGFPGWRATSAGRRRVRAQLDRRFITCLSGGAAPGHDDKSDGDSIRLWGVGRPAAEVSRETRATPKEFGYR